MTRVVSFRYIYLIFGVFLIQITPCLSQSNAAFRLSGSTALVFSCEDDTYSKCERTSVHQENVSIQVSLQETQVRIGFPKYNVRCGSDWVRAPYNGKDAKGYTECRARVTGQSVEISLKLDLQDEMHGGEILTIISINRVSSECKYATREFTSYPPTETRYQVKCSKV